MLSRWNPPDVNPPVGLHLLPGGFHLGIPMAINYEIDGFKMAQWTKLYIFGMVLKYNETTAGPLIPSLSLTVYFWSNMQIMSSNGVLDHKKCPKSISNLEQAL